MTNNTKQQSLIDTIFGVLVRPRSYVQAFYSLVAFPLGTLYFIFLTVGISLGLGLVLVWIGFLILAFVLIASWGLGAFERQQAIKLLGAQIGPMPTLRNEGDDLWQLVANFLKNSVTWKTPAFLLLKFPLGVFSFVVALTSFSLGLALLLAPFYFTWSPPHVNGILIDSFAEAALASVMGVAVLTVGLHLTNGLAWVWRQLAEMMLGQRPSAPTAGQEAVSES